MKITFEELLDKNNRTWLHSTIMSSLPPDLTSKARDDGFFDVKLVINGVEVEPSLFNDLMTNIEEHLTFQARSLIREELSEAEEDARRLREMVKDASIKIYEKYDLYLPDYD